MNLDDTLHVAELPTVERRCAPAPFQPVDWFTPPEMLAEDEQYYAQILANRRREPRGSRTLRQRSLRTDLRAARDEWVRTLAESPRTTPPLRETVLAMALFAAGLFIVLEVAAHGADWMRRLVP